MIQITPQMRLFVAVKPVDFRKGIDGLTFLCRTVLKSDPFSGYVFVFRNRPGTSVKILVYDGQGFWLCQKRLSTGKFKWWPKDGDTSVQIQHHELMLLLWNGDPEQARITPVWKKIVRV